MWCHSCREEYEEEDAGTCKECYEEASERRRSSSGRSRTSSPRSPSSASALLPAPPPPPPPPPTSSSTLPPPPASAPPCPHPRPQGRPDRLSSELMLESEMEESRSGMIKITDITYNFLHSFVHYLYTAEVLLDEHMACDLLILAEKYQVKHLKAFCEKFMISKINNDNAIVSFAFAHRHNAKQLLEAAFSLILDNISTLTAREEYKELVEKDPHLVVEISEAYLTGQVNIALKE